MNLAAYEGEAHTQLEHEVFQVLKQTALQVALEGCVVEAQEIGIAFPRFFVAAKKRASGKEPLARGIVLPKEGYANGQRYGQPPCRCRPAVSSFNRRAFITAYHASRGSACLP